MLLCNVKLKTTTAVVKRVTFMTTTTNSTINELTDAIIASYNVDILETTHFSRINKDVVLRSYETEGNYEYSDYLIKHDVSVLYLKDGELVTESLSRNEILLTALEKIKAQLPQVFAVWVRTDERREVTTWDIEYYESSVIYFVDLAFLDEVQQGRITALKERIRENLLM